MFLGPLFYESLERTRIIARCFWVLIGFMILHLPVCITMLLLVPDMSEVFWVRPYLVLSINFLAVISSFVNNLFITLDPLEGLGYSLSFVLICCKVLVPFLLLLSLFYGFVGSLNLSRGISSLAPAKGLCLRQRLVPVEARLLIWLILIKGIFVAFMASLVIYIRQSRILSLSNFLVTYIHLRNLVT